MLRYEDEDGTEYTDEAQMYLTIHPISLESSTDNSKQNRMQ